MAMCFKELVQQPRRLTKTSSVIKDHQIGFSSVCVPNCFLPPNLIPNVYVSFVFIPRTLYLFALCQPTVSPLNDRIFAFRPGLEESWLQCPSIYSQSLLLNHFTAPTGMCVIIRQLAMFVSISFLANMRFLKLITCQLPRIQRSWCSGTLSQKTYNLSAKAGSV